MNVKMTRQLITMCIFCLVCCLHTPCASHGAVSGSEPYMHDGFKDPNIPKMETNKLLNLRENSLGPSKIGTHLHNDNEAIDIDNHRNTLDKQIKEADLSAVEIESLKRIFSKFGDGEKMTLQDFENLLQRLNLLHALTNKVHSHDVSEDDTQIVDTKKEARDAELNKTCFSKETIAVLQRSAEHRPLNYSTFSEACPVLIYSLLGDTTCPDHHEMDQFEVSVPVAYKVDGTKLLYTCLAVFIISICGVMSLVIIPLMQKRFYKPLIQFLVALAVGTLAGDALLHLMPHAMGAGHSHEHDHLGNTWKGMAAMGGLVFFFLMEKQISLISKWRKKNQKRNSIAHTHVEIYDDQGDRRHSTQCMDKYNTYPYCYNDIITEPSSKTDLQMKNSRSPTLEKLGSTRNMPDADLISTPCIEAKMLPFDHEDYRVIVREHESDHHGHSHKHGHVHSAPQNYSSVAWMVIMGDGLHNFTDGMAIGAAFASGLAGGFSTTVAVFCHELPHELGDFAMLLKAGMSSKQALFYNLLSSGLCFLGSLIGLYLGNTEEANQWVFAAAAGTFIYIALVDMIPELSSAHEDEDDFLLNLLQFSGLLVGTAIMAVIALYEDDLKHLFNDPE